MMTYENAYILYNSPGFSSLPQATQSEAMYVLSSGGYEFERHDVYDEDGEVYHSEKERKRAQRKKFWDDFKADPFGSIKESFLETFESVKQSFFGFFGKFLRPIGNGLKVTAGIAPIVIDALMGENPFEKDAEKDRSDKVEREIKSQEKIDKKQKKILESKAGATNELSDLTTKLGQVKKENNNDILDIVDQAETKLEESKQLALPPPIESALKPLSNANANANANAKLSMSVTPDDFQTFKEAVVLKRKVDTEKGFKTHKANIEHASREDVNPVITNGLVETMDYIKESVMSLHEAIADTDTDELMQKANGDLLQAIEETKKQISNIVISSNANNVLIAQHQDESNKILERKTDALLLNSDVNLFKEKKNQEEDLIESQIQKTSNQINALEINNEELEVQEGKIQKIIDKLKNKVLDSISPSQLIGRTVAAGLYAIGDKLANVGLDYEESQAEKTDVDSMISSSSESTTSSPKSSTPSRTAPAPVATNSSSPKSSIPSRTAPAPVATNSSSPTYIYTTQVQPMQSVPQNIAKAEVSRIGSTGDI